jgi:hypothetical protein
MGDLKGGSIFLGQQHNGPLVKFFKKNSKFFSNFFSSNNKNFPPNKSLNFILPFCKLVSKLHVEGGMEFSTLFAGKGHAF